MKLTLNQSSEYVNERGFKFRGRSTTYRTMRTLNENGTLKTEKIHLGEKRFIYRIDTDDLDDLIGLYKFTHCTEDDDE